jgi:predicted NACHT family NTPase
MADPRWREVFLLTVGISTQADYLLQLMKRHINGLVASDQQLQQLLIWLNEKSLAVQAPYKPAAIRAFYLTLVLPSDLSLTRDWSLALAIDPRLAGDIAPDLALDVAFKRVLSLSLALPSDPFLDQVVALILAFPDDRIVVCNPGLQREAKLPPLGESLQQLKEQLCALVQSRERLKEWWNSNGQTWIEKLMSVMLQCRNMGHQWQFSDQQKEVLKQYYVANQLLVGCLSSASEVTPAVFKEIEETLLLPIAQIRWSPNAEGMTRPMKHLVIGDLS